jgi:hypothetical protein
MVLYLFRIAIRDEPGVLARVARYLANWHVDLKGFVCDASGMQLLTSDLDAARSAFEEAGIVTMITPVYEVTIPDRPGALAALCERLSEAGINIVTALGVASGHTGRICLHVDQAAKAAPILDAFNEGAPLAPLPYWNLA